MFGLGVHELMIVGIVAVLLFGRKLPEVARSLGSSYREFRKGLNEFQSTVNADTYSSSYRSTYNNNSYSTPALPSQDEYADTATAPKFEPPAAEPQSEPLASSEPATPPADQGEASPDQRRYEGSSYT